MFTATAPALTVTNPKPINVSPEGYRGHVANILAAHWPDVEVAIAPTSNSGQPRETLTEEQLAVLSAGRTLLGQAEAGPEAKDYRDGILDLLSLQMFGDLDSVARVTDHLDPWPPIDDVTLATLGRLVVKTLRNRPLGEPHIESLVAIRQHARDLQIVFEI